MSKNVTETSAGKPFLERQALQKLISWKKALRRNALCVVGARQIGKTMLIRHFARQHYEHFVEINFATEPLAKAVFSGSLNAEAVITALSAYARRPLVPGETLIFLDEIQECPQARADIKFLVADGRFDYIKSGFLLGAETKNGPSLPVGYETRLTMYPLDFAEFCTACGLQSVTFEYLKTCFETLQPVAESVHDSMLRLFYTYMVVGGMPQCVSTYLATHDIGQVLAVQNDILDRYRQDITRSGGRDMEKVLKTFEAIPFQLATKNRRFMLSEIAKSARLLLYENAFALLADAGVAMPCYNVTRPTTPLASNEKRNLFKLFLCDTGLLAAASLQNIQFDILQGNVGVNQGSILENLFETVSVFDKDTVTVVLFPVIDNVFRIQVIEKGFFAVDNAVLILKLIIGLEKEQPAMMNIGNIVGDFIQVACNMGGDQDRMIFFLAEFPEKVEDFIPEYWIQAVGRFIHDQKFGRMTERDGKLQLGFHSPGKCFQAFLCGWLCNREKCCYGNFGAWHQTKPNNNHI